MFSIPEDNCIRVILISSDSLPVVSSKLIAYKTFKRAINRNEIYLQHEYEDFDDVAKLIANNILTSFCHFLDFIIHVFNNDLHKIMFDNYDKPLHVMEIRQYIHDVFKRFAHKYDLFGFTAAGYEAVNILKNN